MKTILLLTISLFLSLCAPRAHAWSGPGHMLVAAWAYKELTPAEQHKVDAILSQHPRFTQWQRDFPSGVPGLTRGLYYVMAASLYPDQIRNHSNPATFPNWHFVDYALKPPGFPFSGPPTPQDDVLFGIGRSQANIRSSRTSASEKAVSMSFLLHLVGDIHQPLHCATLFNADFPPPDGDRGGNSVFVRGSAGGAGFKLHSFWDGQFGTGQTADGGKVRSSLQQATALRASTQRNGLPELRQHTSAKSWSLESRLNAIHDAYLDGNLRYGKTQGAAVALPATYSGNAKTVAQHRIALAGYRLADTLRNVLR
jgi:hypothetical protein